MFKKIKKKYYFIIILIIFLIVEVFLINDKRNLTLPEKVLKDTTIYIEKIIIYPISFIVTKINDLKELNNIKNKYNKLKQQIEQNEFYKAKYEETKKNNQELKSLLELNQTLDELNYINATTVNRNIGFWYNNVTIDKGQKDGIKIGSAVITNKGLIGEVISTTYYNSDVKLITSVSINNKISVKIQVNENFIYGLLTTYNKEDNSFVLEGIYDNTLIPTDSLVTTTGLGNNYPAGLLIGKVKSITKDNFDLAMTLKIIPTVDFNNINFVTVLETNREE
ncbi:MAG: rod shape-determining protein MreC [Bacilli bacterium]